MNKIIGKRVTIYVWYRNTVGKTKLDLRIGHTALKTYGPTGIYASVWPLASVKLMDRKGVPCKLHTCYKEDVAAENGHEADLTIDLYSLNTDAIENKFSAIRQFIMSNDRSFSNINFSVWSSTA